MAFAQPGNDSPYSYFGVGNLVDTRLVRYSGMGGLGIAIREDSIPFAVNFSNPASYTAIRFTSFDIAGYGSIATLRDASTSENVNKANLSYFALGFPVTKWWGGAFGIRNFSTLGYTSINSEEVPYADDTLTVNWIQQGKGGVDQFFIGAGFKPFKNFSFGFNASFLFGTISRIRLTEVGEQNYFSSSTFDEVSVRGFYFDYGMQYTIPIKTSSLTLGVWGAAPLDVYAPMSRLSTMYYPTVGGISDRDTVVMRDSSTWMHMPLRLGFGAMAQVGRKWGVGGEFLYEQWSQFRDTEGKAEGLGDLWRGSVGVEFRPSFEYNKRGFWSYFGKMHYRIGGFYAQSQYVIAGTRVPEYGTTIGLGFPVSRMRAGDNQFVQSMVNISVEWGQRGSVSNGLLLEDYWKFKLGFTLNDKWFIKRKYF
jgi:hypothetical protein